MPVQDKPVTVDNYQANIKSTFGVSDERAAAIAQEYPTSAYPDAPVAFSVLVSDANFACTTFQTNTWTSARVPTFAYELDDPAPPPRYADIPVATHTSELAYLLELPNAPLQIPLTADQQRLAASMRAAWAKFAATGNPSTAPFRGRRSATAVRGCRWWRHNHRSTPSSPPATTARSGRPADDDGRRAPTYMKLRVCSEESVSASMGVKPSRVRRVWRASAMSRWSIWTSCHPVRIAVGVVSPAARSTRASKTSSLSPAVLSEVVVASFDGSCEPAAQSGFELDVAFEVGERERDVAGFVVAGEMGDPPGERVGRMALEEAQ